MSPAQQRALTNLLPRFGLPFAQTPLDFTRVFGRAAPVILEIGFGMGETTAAMAAACPAHDFLGLEVHGPGVGALLNRVEAAQLSNVRVIQHDAVEVLQQMIPQDSLAGVHVYFPDPWPKKRHHKRRLLQPEFVALLAGRMKTGAYLHAATDWQEYAEQILDVLKREPRLVNTAPDYAPRPPYRPQTKFEARGLKLGHGVWDIIFRKM